MKRVFLLLIMSAVSVLAFPQNSKKVKALKKQQIELQNTIKKSKAELNRTKQQVKAGTSIISVFS